MKVYKNTFVCQLAWEDTTVFLKKFYTYTKDDENSIVNPPVLKTLYSIVKKHFPDCISASHAKKQRKM